MKKKSKINLNEYFDRANAAREAGQFGLAKRLFIKTSKMLDKRGRAIYLGLAAECEKEQGRYSKAMQLLRKAQRSDPTVSMVHLNIGLLQLKLNRPKLAQRAFEKAICIEPKAYTHVFLAIAFRRQGRLDREKACYKAALRLDPNYEEAHYNLGVCYKFEDRNDKAEKHFRRAIAIDPKYAIAYAELGSVLFKKRQYKESSRILRKAVKLSPDYYYARLYFAVVLGVLRSLKEAEKQYREAIRIAPREFIAYALLGDFLSAEQRGKPERYLKKALALEPNDDTALYFMGKHWYRREQDEQAIFYLKKAARKGHEDAKRLLDKINKKRRIAGYKGFD